MARPGDRPRSLRSIPKGPPRTAEEEAMTAGHELRDMRLRQVVGWLALLTIATTILVVAVTAFEAVLIGGIGPLRPVIDEPPRVTPPPEPRLETANGEMIRALRAQEDPLLGNYTWIDQAGGSVRLPIDRALELTIQRGLPVRSQDGAQDGLQETPGLTLPQGSSSGRTLERIP